MSDDIDKNKMGKLGNIGKQVSNLSLGISMVVATLSGFGIGYLLYKLLGYYWLIWVGLFYGVAAAVLNVFKAYRSLKKELDEIQSDEKYIYEQKLRKDDKKRT